MDAIASPFAATMLESLPQGDTRELHRLFPSAGPDAADLLAKCAAMLYHSQHSLGVSEAHRPQKLSNPTAFKVGFRVQGGLDSGVSGFFLLA